MTTVYVDPVGTALPDAHLGNGSNGATLLPGALEALNRLCEARFDVVLLIDKPVQALASLDGRVRYDHGPVDDGGPFRRPRHIDGDRPWLIASDEGWSERERPVGVRTIRVGPKRPVGRRPGARFDLEARDLPAAVMEILVRDTMP